MDIFKTFVLGAVQGLTEFIPVSSSGHLELTQQIIGGRGADFHMFLELINLGTFLALLIFFRKKIYQILVDIFENHNWKLARNIIITSIPAGALGMVFAKLIEKASFFSSMVTIALAIGLVGIIMIFIEKIPTMEKIKGGGEKLTAGKALMIGIAQTLALIPGASRSGTTIIAGRIAGLDSKEAAEYSFLVSIPITLGICLKTVLSKSSLAYFGENWQMLLFSNLVAFVFGLWAVNFVMNFVKRKDSLKYFGIYRLVISILILTLIGTGVLG